jgi:hypothetical protein
MSRTATDGQYGFGPIGGTHMELIRVTNGHRFVDQSGSSRVSDHFFVDNPAMNELVVLQMWTEMSCAVKVGREVLTVPSQVGAFIGLRDGWWVWLHLLAPNEYLPDLPNPVVNEFRVIRDLWPADVSSLPNLAFKRWMDATYRAVNQAVLLGMHPPSAMEPRPTRPRRRRSDSPSDSELRDVVQRRLDGQTWEDISHALGKSTRTIRRYHEAGEGLAQHNDDGAPS